MPRRLAITARHFVEVIEYEDRPLQPTEALRTEVKNLSPSSSAFTSVLPSSSYGWQRNSCS